MNTFDYGLNLLLGKIRILGTDRHQPLSESGVGLLFQDFVKGLASRLGILGKVVGLEVAEVQVGVEFVAMRGNLHELPATLRWAAGKGATFRRANPPVALLRSVSFANRSEACRAEAALKKLTREKKLAWAKNEG